MRNLQTSASIHRDFVTIAPHIYIFAYTTNHTRIPHITHNHVTKAKTVNETPSITPWQNPHGCKDDHAEPGRCKKERSLFSI